MAVIMDDKKTILSRDVAAAKLQRMALEVAERLSGEKEPLIIIGIKDSGMVIAERITALLKPYVAFEIKVLSLLMDKHMPYNIILSGDCDFNNKNILLIDDVCNTGKTLLYALKPFLQFRPKRIQTLVLVERMHKLFPIKPDYIGLSVATTSSDFIQVEVNGDEITAMLNS